MEFHRTRNGPLPMLQHEQQDGNGLALRSMWISSTAARRRPYVRSSITCAVSLESFGADVRIEGRTTYTPFVRRWQFAAVAAATRTRVDIGLRYTDKPASELLVQAKAPGQATHKLSLTSMEEITGEVERLLRMAYDQNG